VTPPTTSDASVSARRLGAETSQTRAALLDAAEELMLEEGYAAVTSRHVAAKAGLKPQLVHYYFRTMDDLFLALYRRGAELGLEYQARALASAQPLWSLWDSSRDPRGNALKMEFIALANHRKDIQAEISASAELYRSELLAGVQAVFDRYGAAAGFTPIVFAVLMTSVSQFLLIEKASLGMTTGHDEMIAFMEEQLTRIEGERRR
jgi:AcrR family transcriptional regulator